MWGSDTRSIALEAKAMAERAVQEATGLGALTRAHIDDCTRRADKLESSLARRDEMARADLHEWRVILGQRLDKQDRMNWIVAGAVIMGLAGIIASLLHTYGWLKP